MTQVLQVDELSFAVKRSARRHTLELIIDRGGELVIAAPSNANEVSMAAFVREKKFWLYRELAEKEAKQQPAGGKEFNSGEGFPYLGRSYRLLLVEGQEAPLKLANGRFQLRNDLVAQGRETFIGWYSERARPWLKKRVRGWAPRVEVGSRGIEIRDIGYRWGANHTPPFWQLVGRVLPDVAERKTWLAERGGAYVSL